MISNHKEWNNFERNYKKTEKMSIKKKFNILDSLYEEAVKLKAFNKKNIFEGLDIKIQIAKVINSVSGHS